MNNNQFLSLKIKSIKLSEISLMLRKSGIIILALAIFAFASGELYAQHLFSVSYNELTQEDARQIKAQVSGFGTSITPLTRSIKNEYSISFSSVQNTKIVIFNEETGKNVVITPTEEAPVQINLPQFFIEELRQAVLGDADRYLMIEIGADFSVRNAAAISSTTETVFIPRYLYGPKENVNEALPKDRQIIHIFKEKPRLIPAFPDDPENLRYAAQLEEEMSYCVYMGSMPK